MKKLFKYFEWGSPAYVVLHSLYRRSRGRRPVATAKTEANPRLALKKAQDEFRGDGVVMLRLIRSCSVRTIRTVMDRVGLRALTIEEVMKSKGQVNSDGPDWEPKARVPYFSWNDGDINFSDDVPGWRYSGLDRNS